MQPIFIGSDFVLTVKSLDSERKLLQSRAKLYQRCLSHRHVIFTLSLDTPPLNKSCKTHSMITSSSIVMKCWHINPSILMTMPVSAKEAQKNDRKIT